VGEDSKGEGAFISALSFSVFFGHFFVTSKKVPRRRHDKKTNHCQSGNKNSKASFIAAKLYKAYPQRIAGGILEIKQKVDR